MIQLTFYSGVPKREMFAFQRSDRADKLAEWEARVGKVFGGFTKYTGTGYWQGEWENSLTYVIVFSEIAVPDWDPIAKNFKLSLGETLSQSEVLVTWEYLGGLL